MIVVMRVIAQLIDILLCIGIYVVSFIYASPVFAKWVSSIFGISSFSSNVFAAALTLILGTLVAVLVQLPFLKTNQTIGKTFASLEIVSTNKNRPLNMSILFQREIFCKLVSCFIICLPVFVGKTGWHELATETQVVRKR